MNNKKWLRKKRRDTFLLNKPIVCKIEIAEGDGTKVLEFDGGMKDGFIKFRNICKDLFQIDLESGDENDTKYKSK
jgi:hypothetical protein